MVTPTRKSRALLALGVALALGVVVALALVARGGCGRGEYRPATSGAPPAVDWIAFPGGEFEMGSRDGQPDERPPHRVVLAPFALSRTEVTVAQYRACVSAGACTEPRYDQRECTFHSPGADDRPVNCVTFQQALDFARFVNARLPSEAEWEYAARGGGRRVRFPWGDTPPDCAHAVMGYFRSEGWERPEETGCGTRGALPVCSRPPGHTAEGLCDMAGNVFEWVQDYYHESYEDAPADGRAREDRAPGAEVRVVRGGAFAFRGDILGTTYRAYSVPNAQYPETGIRIARDGHPEGETR